MFKSNFIFFSSVIILLCENDVSSFNVDTRHYTFYEAQPRSMFGYSVLGYRDQNNKGWVIIGSPNQTQPNGNMGTIVKCEITNDNLCFDIKINRAGSKTSEEEEITFGTIGKTDQRLGVSLSTSTDPKNGPIVACAPNYFFKYNETPYNTEAGLKRSVAACWLTTESGDKKPIEFSPCSFDDKFGRRKREMCQGGIGISVSKDGSKLLVNAPGNFYWEGKIENNTNLPRFSQQSTSETNLNSFKLANVFPTQEDPEANKENNYHRYSVAVGNFLGQDDKGLAIGFPIGFDLNGKVLLFSPKLDNYQNISGYQIGAYFGYALAVCDVDGDKFDDLVISAPLYTQPELAKLKIETGRIYVFYQGKEKNKKFTKIDTRDGENNRGQFGLSVASLKDLDLDGYGDFVVGEPYGGPHNRGAIYIYRGTKDGLEKKYSQAIFPENFGKPVSSFGWSLSGGMDLDNNLYPDIVVGAYESNSAVLFRSRPVISVNAEISFLSDVIYLNKKNCILDDGSAVACTDLKICFSYGGVGTFNSHSFHISINLDDKKTNNPRLFFYDTSSTHFLNVLNKTVQVHKIKLWCKTYKVFVRHNLRDKLTSLDAEIQIELAKNFSSSSGYRDFNQELSPILGIKNTKIRTSLIIKNDCGWDNICVPNLKLTVSTAITNYNPYSNETIDLNIKISNDGEDAFESSFYLELSTDVQYINFTLLKDSVDVQCTYLPEFNRGNVVFCDIGNPLTTFKNAYFRISLIPVLHRDIKRLYEFRMKVNSTNPEKPENLKNNIAIISLPLLEIKSNLFIKSESRPQAIYVDADYTSNTDFSKTKLESTSSVIHEHIIRNDGPITTLNITATFYPTAETIPNNVLSYSIKKLQICLKKKNHCTGTKYNQTHLNLHYESFISEEELSLIIEYSVNVPSIKNFENYFTNRSSDKSPEKKLEIVSKLEAIVILLPYVDKPTTYQIAESIAKTSVMPVIYPLKTDKIPVSRSFNLDSTVSSLKKYIDSLADEIGKLRAENEKLKSSTTIENNGC